MNPYAALALAIGLEVAGTTALKFVDGFTNPLPSAVVLVGYGLSFYFLSGALEELPIGMIYATWSGLGIVSIAVIGLLWFDERLDLAAVVGVGLIVLGVYVLNVVSDVSAH